MRNFYLNKGYYNVDINSSFVKLLSSEEFEIIYNINANEKIYFNDLNLNLPADYTIDNFDKIKNLFSRIKGEP